MQQVWRSPTQRGGAGAGAPGDGEPPSVCLSAEEPEPGHSAGTWLRGTVWPPGGGTVQGEQLGVGGPLSRLVPSEQVLHLWLEVLCSSLPTVEKWYQPWSFLRSPGWVQIKCELR